MTADIPRPRSSAATLTLTRPTPVPLPFAPHSLVVVAGLPGAGKTTLVRRLSGVPGVHALDAEDVARRLKGLLPYRVLRPLVHTAHLTLVVTALWSGHPCVLTSDPLTSPLRRRVLRTAARLAGRRLHVVLVHASPAQARDGQSRRGRHLSTRRQSRHETRYRTWLGSTLGSDVDLALSREEAASAVLVAARPAAARPAAPRLVVTA
jgi:predicted kinase